jgi:hypothetical protein
VLDCTRKAVHDLSDEAKGLAFAGCLSIAGGTKTHRGRGVSMKSEKIRRRKARQAENRRKGRSLVVALSKKDAYGNTDLTPYNVKKSQYGIIAYR